MQPEFFKQETQSLSNDTHAYEKDGKWYNPLGQVSSDTLVNVSSVSQKVNITDVYVAVENDSKFKRDEMSLECDVRLDNFCKAKDYPFTKNGLLTLNSFTAIPNAMLEYLYTNDYLEDYAEYCNKELDLRATKPRVSKNFLLRFREIEGQDHIRGVMSDRYGIIDHIDVMKSIFAALPGDLYDVYVSNYSNDGDSLSGNVIMPDYIKEHEDSEYSCGFTFGNSEIKTKTFSIKPYLYRAVDNTGYIWGKRDLTINVNMKHFGKIEQDKINSLVKIGIETSLSMGKNLIVLFEYAKKIGVDNGLRVIASLCRDYKLTTKQGKVWHKHYLHSAYQRTAFGIINSLSQAALEFSDATREGMEMCATQMLASNLNTTQEQMEKRWYSINSKCNLLDAKTVAQYEFCSV
jgi:hypothetical protein